MTTEKRRWELAYEDMREGGCFESVPYKSGQYNVYFTTVDAPGRRRYNLQGNVVAIVLFVSRNGHTFGEALDEPTTEDGLLDDHICGQESDKHGRITPECEQCFWDAYFEGQHTGIHHTLTQISTRLVEAIKKRYDPLAVDDEKEATARWRTIKSLTKLVDDTIAELDRKEYDRYGEEMDRRLRRVMTEEQFDRYAVERGERGSR